MHRKFVTSMGLAVTALFVVWGCQPQAGSTATTTSKSGTATASSGSVVTAGLTGQDAAAALMAKWKAANPGSDWEANERLSRAPAEPHDNSALLAKGSQKEGHPYRNLSQRDLDMWARETQLLVLAGSKVFHSADEMDSTIAVSCDMCHPHAANTHPETYPKFQTQIGKVVLLRDMINWCLEKALRAPQMEPDDPRMKAMEAYILAQRKGTPLAFGKH